MQMSPFKAIVALTNTYTTNLLNPPTTTGGVNASSAPYDKTKIIIRKIKVMNKTAGAITFRLYLGATGANAAGTELYYDHSIAANSEFNDYGYFVLSTSDFLVGGASANTSLVLQVEGEIGIGF